MSVRFALLGFLVDGPAHGYRLRRRFEQEVGRVWELNGGQVYQALRALDKEGFIEPFDDEKPREGKLSAPEKRRYSLTTAGRDALARWLRRAPSLPGPTRHELLVRLALLEPNQLDEAFARIDAQAGVYEQHLSLLVAQRSPAGVDDGSGIVASLALDAAILQAEAQLAWLSACRERLSESRTGPTDGTQT